MISTNLHSRYEPAPTPYSDCLLLAGIAYCHRNTPGMLPAPAHPGGCGIRRKEQEVRSVFQVPFTCAHPAGAGFRAEHSVDGIGRWSKILCDGSAFGSVCSSLYFRRSTHR